MDPGVGDVAAASDVQGAVPNSGVAVVVGQADANDVAAEGAARRVAISPVREAAKEDLNPGVAGAAQPSLLVVPAAGPSVRIAEVGIQDLVVADVVAHGLREPEGQREASGAGVVVVVTLNLDEVVHAVQCHPVVVLHVRLPAQGHSPAGPPIHISAAQDVDLDCVAVPVAHAQLILAALVGAVGLRVGNVVGLDHDARHGAQVVVVVGLVAAAAKVCGRLPRPGQVGSFDVPLHLGRKPGRCVPLAVVRRRVHDQEDAAYARLPAICHRGRGCERRRATEPIQHDSVQVVVHPSHARHRFHRGLRSLVVAESGVAGPRFAPIRGRQAIGALRSRHVHGGARRFRAGLLVGRRVGAPARDTPLRLGRGAA